MNILGITLARGGSKGVKKKNIRLLHNKPLIQYTIDETLKSEYIDRYIVSTDDNQIAEVSKELGAEVPFLRPKKFAKDFTSTEDTLKNALLSIEKHIGYKFDICVYLTANRIFRKVKWIKTAVNNLIKIVLPVSL